MRKLFKNLRYVVLFIFVYKVLAKLQLKVFPHANIYILKLPHTNMSQKIVLVVIFFDIRLKS